MSSTTVWPPRVARHATLLKDTIRSSRSRANVPQSDPYVAQLAKDLLSRNGDHRRQAFEQVCALVADMGKRCDLSEAESAGYMLIAIARHEHGIAHPGTSRTLSVADAHLAEQHAEGVANDAETAFSHASTVSNYLKYLAASAEHIKARQQLDEAVREEIVRLEAKDAKAAHLGLGA